MGADVTPPSPPRARSPQSLGVDQVNEMLAEALNVLNVLATVSPALAQAGADTTDLQDATTTLQDAADTVSSTLDTYEGMVNGAGAADTHAARGVATSAPGVASDLPPPSPLHT